MGRQAKLKRQRKQAIQDKATADHDSPTTASTTAPTTATATGSAADEPSIAPHTVPITRDFLNQMERQGYSLKADNRVPDITDERPQRR
ncbi:MAG: hypothetical protein EAZ61_09170 [Oscillatoriales cyanobacterium]|nr:MAG: hypothetical protein EAZ61_09170 [Oscillatoriales cyanobacterium]